MVSLKLLVWLAVAFLLMAVSPPENGGDAPASSSRLCGGVKI
jgi:hypothetical protein